MYYIIEDSLDEIGKRRQNENCIRWRVDKLGDITLTPSWNGNVNYVHFYGTKGNFFALRLHIQGKNELLLGLL